MYNIIFHYSTKALVIIGVVLFLLAFFAFMYTLRKNADRINQEIENSQNASNDKANDEKVNTVDNTTDFTINIDASNEKTTTNNNTVETSDSATGTDIKNTKSNTLEDTEDFASYYEKVVNSEEHKVKGRFNY